MSGGLPGLAGSDHIGFTVPDIEEATRFFVDVIGCEVAFEIGPFVADDDCMGLVDSFIDVNFDVRHMF